MISPMLDENKFDTLLLEKLYFSKTWNTELQNISENTYRK